MPFIAILITTMVGTYAWHRHRAAPRPLAYRLSNIPEMEADKAIAFYEHKLGPHSNNGIELAILAGLYVAEGRNTGELGWYDKAEATAKQSLAVLPQDNHAAQLVLAKVAEARHQFAEAIRIASDVAKHGKSPAEGLGVLITSHLAVGNVTEAARFADELADLRPSLGNLSLRGLVLLAQGRDDEAVHDLESAIALEDIGEQRESAWARAILARHYLTVGNYREAEFLLREAIRIVPHYHLALALRGELELARGDAGAAGKALMEAFGASKQIPYLRWYAQAREQAGDRHAAQEVRAQAERLVREELAAGQYGHRVELAQILLDEGDGAKVGEAIALASEEAKSRRNAETLWVLSTALERAGRLMEARTWMERILRTGVRDPRYYDEAARIERGLGHGARAAFYEQLAVKANPAFRVTEKKRLAEAGKTPERA